MDARGVQPAQRSFYVPVAYVGPGEELWKFQCGSGHHGSSMTYSVDGKQYVAVPVGWGGWLEGIIPGMLGAGHGDALIVFALPD